MQPPFDPAHDGNLFPREDLLEAVAESDWRDRPTPLIAWIALAVGIAALSLGTPLARVVFAAETEAAAALEGAASWGAPVLALCAALGRGLGLGIEAALFGVAALGAGAFVLATGVALRAFGFGGRLALCSTLLASLTGLMVFGGRLPTLTVPLAASAALCLAACAAPLDPGPRGARGFGLRVGLSALFAVLVAPEAVVLLVPAWLALYARPLPELRGHALRAAGGFLALAMVVAALAPTPPGPDGVPPAWVGRARTTVLPGLDGAWPGLGGIGLTAWLAAGALVLAWPLSLIREDEESGPPLWLHLWVGVALAASFLSVRAAAIALPALAALTANALARRARPDGALRLALGFFVLQAAVLLWVGRGLARTDSPFAEGSAPLTASDVVLVNNPHADGAYLLRRRLGVRVETRESYAGDSAGRVLWATDLGPPIGADGVLDLGTGEVRLLPR